MVTAKRRQRARGAEPRRRFAAAATSSPGVVSPPVARRRPPRGEDAPCSAVSLGDVVAIGAAVPYLRSSERVALPDGRSGQPGRHARARCVRRRRRIRAGAPEPFVDRPARGRDDDRRDVLLHRAIAIAPRKNQRAKFLARVDALLGTSEAAVERASERYPGDYRRSLSGSTPRRSRRLPKRELIVVELAPGQSAVARAVLRLLPTLPGWEIVLARTAPLTRRPTIPAAVRDRARTKSLVKARSAAGHTGGGGHLRAGPRRQCPSAARGKGERLRDCRSAGLAEQPELAAASVARLVEDEALRSGSGEKARATALKQDFDRARKAARRRVLEDGRPAARRSPSVPPGRRSPRRPGLDRGRPPHAHPSFARLLDRAEGTGRARRGGRVGAIAVTDHNVFAGALETVEIARTASWS